MRVAIAAAVACLSIIGMTATAQVHAAIRKHTEIPAESLDLALRALAKDRGFQLVYLTENVAALETRGAIGEFTVDEALKKLLSDSRLEYKFVDDNTVSIFSMSNTIPSQTGDRTDDVSKEGKTDSSGSFRLAQATTGISGPVAQKFEAPQDSVTLAEVVVTAQKRIERLQDVPVAVTRGQRPDAGGDTRHFTGRLCGLCSEPAGDQLPGPARPGQSRTAGHYHGFNRIEPDRGHLRGRRAGRLEFDLRRRRLRGYRFAPLRRGAHRGARGAARHPVRRQRARRSLEIRDEGARPGADANSESASMPPTVHNATTAGYGVRASANVPLIAE